MNLLKWYCNPFHIKEVKKNIRLFIFLQFLQLYNKVDAHFPRIYKHRNQDNSSDSSFSLSLL